MQEIHVGDFENHSGGCFHAYKIINLGYY